MRRASLFLTTLVLAAMLLAACGGQRNSTSVPGKNVPAATKTTGTAVLTTTPNVPVTGGDDSPNRLTNLMKYEVRNQNGDQIGNVNDVVLDFDNSSIPYVVVGTGGFLGLGEKKVLVPWNMLKLQTGSNGAASDQKALVFSGNQDAYKNYPDMDMSHLLPVRGQPAKDWDAAIVKYWQNGGTAASAQATNTPENAANVTPTAEATAVPGARQLKGVMLASDLLDSTIEASAGTASNNGGSKTSGTAAPGTSQATATATSNSTGSATTDLKVEDVILKPDSGKVQYIVVKGAFPNGQLTIPVPGKYLLWDAANQKFNLGVNTTGLANAPAFQDDQYPDFSKSDWASQIEKYWNNIKSDLLIKPAS